MLSSWINHASDWNPQLIREIKGRLKAQNVLFAIALSVILQLMVLGVFYTLLPVDGANANMKYCLEVISHSYTCVENANGSYLVDWQHWWIDITRTLHWLLMYGLMVPGVFMLVFDLAQEEQRGTFTFIRLSPQSAWDVLLGKILGVPILVYIGAATVIPFHMVAAAGAQFPGWMLLSFYVVLLGGSFFIFSVALLNGFLSKFPGRVAGIHLAPIFALAAMALAFVFVPVYLMGNAYITWHPFLPYFMSEAYGEEMVLPLGYNIAIAHAFVLINLAISTYWVWQALHRCFHQPGATIISKKQSYGLIAYIEVLLVAIAIYAYHLGEVPDPFSAIALLSVLNIFIFLGLTVLLSNNRQNVVDWARYRHVEAKTNLLESDGLDRSARKRGTFWQEWVWGERSPSVVAIALNLLIFGVLLLPLIVFYLDSSPEQLYALAGVVITINLLILYAAIAQLALLMKTRHPELWAIGLVGVVMVLPIAGALFFLGLERQSWVDAILLMSPFPWNALQLWASPALSHIGFSILAQWTAIALVNLQLNRRLNQLGQSASKQLLAGK